MVDMKEVPDGDADDYQATYASDDEIYPNTLRISLDDDDLKKLGITDLPKVGDTMTMNARVLVTRVSDENNFYGRERCVGFQITDMELGGAE